MSAMEANADVAMEIFSGVIAKFLENLFKFQKLYTSLGSFAIKFGNFGASAVNEIHPRPSNHTTTH